MEVLFDYRPALRARTGVGEYLHQLLAALAATRNPHDTVELFSSSWKDRVSPETRRAFPDLRIRDARAPVRALHFAWHRLGWPRVEFLTGRSYDVVHAGHPMLIPANAAQIVTVHDLDFLDHPEWTSGEARRDFAALVRRHVHAAHGVVTPSEHTARQVADRLGVPADTIAVGRPGPPEWVRGGRRQPRTQDGPLLFVGTLEPRKNVGTLLDAYTRLLDRLPDAPPLHLMGGAGADAKPWLERIAQPPLAGRVSHLGYVPDAARREVFESASLLVMPSWSEGFGLPALEAMALGIPVVASTGGALPEVVGAAGLLVDPSSPDALADAIMGLLTDSARAEAFAAAGVARAAEWSWIDSARRVWALYPSAIDRYRHSHAHRD